jgi:hypothetical protein
MDEWPQRTDGTNKTVGEMTPAERAEVMAASKARVMAGVPTTCIETIGGENPIRLSFQIKVF